MKKIKVAINGFGRIGRPVLKIALEKENLEVVAINDLTDLKSSAHLFKYDSIYGTYPGEIEVDEDDSNLIVSGEKIKYLTEPDPEKLPWKDLAVDIILECSGIFKDREGAQKHLDAGAKKVILSAPAKGKDIPTYLIGVNAEKYNSETDDVISNGSCTTNCLAPIVKILGDKFGLEKGFMTTTHSYTNDQRLHDSAHRDLRRARAAALSIIPTSTGAATTVARALPDMGCDLDGIALRVPTPVVSIVDFVGNIKGEATAEEINAAFKEISENEMKGILGTTEDELVSMDFKMNPLSSIVDLPLTMANRNLVKIVSWYDNEWGYSNRLVEMAQLVGEKL